MSNLELPSLNKNLEMGSGRFGTLYSDPRDPKNCIKKFKTPIKGKEAENLHRLVEVTRWARPSEALHLLTRFAWPIEIFFNENEVLAFTMPKAPDSCFFDLTTVSRLADRSRPGTVTETKKSRREALQVKYLIDDSWWQGRHTLSRKPELDLEGRLELAIDCSDSLGVLHANELVYGDISANNVVARLEQVPGAYFFDADSISPADYRESEPLFSPGWETPSGLDPFAIDRSRFSLLVLRLLTEVPNARPDDHSSFPNHHFLVRGLLPSLEATYRTGAESSYLELARTLRSSRSIPQADLAFDRAVSTGFARIVLKEQIHARTSSQQVLVEQASNQIEFEERVDLASGLDYRRLLRRSKVRIGQFSLDARPRYELTRPIGTESDLMALIYEAQFEDIVTHLVSSGLGPIEATPAVSRVVEHAHLEVELSKAEINVVPGKAEIVLLWPREDWVNSARLRFRIGSKVQEVIIDRTRREVESKRVVEAPRGGDLQVSLVFGTLSRSGTRFFTSFVQASSKVVPPLPAPTRPRVAPTPQNLLTDLDSDIIVVDPEAQRLEQERLDQAARRKNRRRILIGAGVLSIIALGGVAVRHFFWTNQLINLTSDQVAEAPRVWDQEVWGDDIANIKISAHSATIIWPGQAAASSYHVQTSRDGVNWSRPETFVLQSDGFIQSFDYGNDPAPPLYLIEAVGSRGNVIARQFENALAGTGFEQFPRFIRGNGNVRVIVYPITIPGSRQPTSFQFELLSEPGMTVSFGNATTAEDFTIPLPENVLVTGVRVRSVFPSGTSGSWFGIEF